MGPAIAWPNARPSRQALSVSCTGEAPVPKSRLSDGRAGMYISIDNGPNAVNAPRMNTNCTRRRPRKLWGDTGSRSIILLVEIVFSQADKYFGCLCSYPKRSSHRRPLVANHFLRV